MPYESQYFESLSPPKVVRVEEYAMQRRTPRQSLLRPTRLPLRTPLTPEEIIALKDLVQHNKTQCAALVEKFHCALDEYTSLQQHFKANHDYVLSMMSMEGNA
jgi:hypothetical protein